MARSSTHPTGVRWRALASCIVASICVAVAAADEPPTESNAATSANEQLIVLVRSGTPLATTFATTALPAISTLATELGVPLTVVEVGDGGPADVGITPLIAYQNHLGRSIYQGRFTTTDRIRNFVRTARWQPQGAERLERSDVLARRIGRVTIAVPLKLTPLSGEVPEEHRPDAFRAETVAALESGMNGFERQHVALGRSDRQFYLDVHPYRDGERLFVSMAIFSQFNCHDPVHVRFDDPISGAWAERAEVFRRVGAAARAELDRQQASAERGDGFDALPATTPVKTWAALGLDLPPAPAGSTVDVGSLTLASDWSARSTSDATAPVVAFRFPAPLDAYSGEATRLEARLTLGAGPGVEGATGSFEVDPTSVTMGEPDLDAWLHGADVLDADANPIARFTIERVEEVSGPLRFGEVTTAVLHGRFEMRGRSIPVAVRTSLEPVANEAGQPRLVFVADWTIGLTEPFGIDGPDGPAPANDTLLFTCRVLLAPHSS